MSMIPPRLGSILGLLLEAEAPVPVDWLSKELGTSRRTIFRELERVDSVLSRLGLQLTTKPGAGMLLVGEGDGRARLAALLARESATPQNRQDRQQVLVFLLTDESEVQKLYYFARSLGVSEATVSLDMDALEDRFHAYGLELIRRQGQGAELSGAEADIRRMLVDLIARLENPDAFLERFGRPERQTLLGVRALVQGELQANLDWMTEESLQMLELQLAVMVERVQKHRTLDGMQEAATGLPRQLAGQLCDALEARFAVRLPEPEREAAGLLVRACRTKRRNPLDINDAAAYHAVQKLAYQMIDRFDPDLSHSLKLSEDLVNGLSLHLWSATVRLRQGVEIASPMGEQIQSGFPEIFEKSRRAAAVLERELGVPVPDSEVAFLASHFGAAMLHLGERSRRRVVLKTGIVCVAGIGVSHMMASQVRQRYKGELDVAVSDWSSPGELSGYDLLISSTPLTHTGCPVIVVRPILTEDDHQRIREAIERHTARPADAAPRLSGSLPERLEGGARRFEALAHLLRTFSKLSVSAGCSFDELAKMIGYRFGTRPESGHQIYEDLLAREAVSTQVMAQIGIVLLHARTAGVERPVLGLAAPEAGPFTDSYFSGATGCLVMLAPRDSDRELLEAFGYISSGLVEDHVLLGAVQSGDAAVAYTRIEAALLRYLHDYWSDALQH